MYCLMCGKELSIGSLIDIFVGEDGLCQTCRKQWERVNLHFYLEGIPVEADYVYNDAFSSCLIQYKECFDEALQDVFLYEVKNKIKRKYRGYTIVLMPSSLDKLKQRGFHHLEKMFACCGMKMIDPFIKQSNGMQKKMSYVQRIQIQNQIQLKQGVSLDKKLLLVDDTITSGSTLRGALHCIDCKKHQVKIYCVSANISWVNRLYKVKK